jgi:hypothetical protein
MSATPLDDFLDRLDQAARQASTAEDAYRRDVLQRVKQMEQERAFAFRRLNLVRTIASSLAGAKDEVEAVGRGSAAFLREVNWSGATDSQREVVAKFTPVITALWPLIPREEEEGAPPAAPAVLDIAAPERELAAFETWFSENRTAPFLSLMEGEVLELPLVEV